MRNEFTVHLLNDVGLAKAAELGEAFSALLDKIDEIIPDETHDERAVIVRKLQEAAFVAKRVIAMRPEHQK